MIFCKGILGILLVASCCFYVGSTIEEVEIINVEMDMNLKRQNDETTTMPTTTTTTTTEKTSTITTTKITKTETTTILPKCKVIFSNYYFFSFKFFFIN